MLIGLLIELEVTNWAKFETPAQHFQLTFLLKAQVSSTYFKSYPKLQVAKFKIYYHYAFKHSPIQAILCGSLLNIETNFLY